MSARGPRYEAQQSGQATYLTDKPCSRGHSSPRDTKSGRCLECRREDDRRKYAENPQKFITKKQTWYGKKAEDIKKRRRERYAANPEPEKQIARVRSAEWRAANPDKVKAQKPLKEAYAKANPYKKAAHLAKRRAAKMLRTPKWLTQDDLWMIEQAYEIASLRTKMTGVSHHVDHILPLQGSVVSGLHVPVNLRVIPWYENLSKANKILETTL